MVYLKYFASLAVAWFIGVFGFSQIFISLRVSLPFTKYLELKYGGIDAHAIRSRAWCTVALWLVILGGIAAGLFFWNDRDVLIGAGIGAALAILATFAKSKPGPNTIPEYFQAYGRMISEETMKKIGDDVEKMNGGGNGQDS